RDERYSDFGDASTWLAGYALELTPHWRVFASRSEGFRAPTFNELFFPPIDLGGGAFLACNDPDLEPERARSTDGGVQYAAGPHLLKIAGFRTRISDLIVPGCPPANAESATIEGVEASYTGHWLGADIKAAVTFQDPVQETAAGELQLVRRAKR